MIFVHIPRTGGTTLERILGRNYPADGHFMFDSSNVKASLAEYMSLDYDHRRQLQLITGHIPFGIDRLVGPGAYLTMLRDPVDRVISVYEYIRRRPTHQLHRLVAPMSMREFLESGVHEDAANGQCRWLGGLHVRQRDANNSNLIEVAWRTLTEDFAAFGLTEYFDESLILYKSRFGWKRLAYRRENSLRGRTRASELHPDALRAIKAHNECDIELYDRARRLFVERLAGVSDLPREVALLRRSTRTKWPGLAAESKLRWVIRRARKRRAGERAGHSVMPERDAVAELMSQADLAGWRTVFRERFTIDETHRRAGGE